MIRLDHKGEVVELVEVPHFFKVIIIQVLVVLVKIGMFIIVHLVQQNIYI